MALNIYDNQSLGFHQSSDCKCGGVYCQPVITTDTMMIQGDVTPYSTSILWNGTFASEDGWNLGNGWSIASNVLTGITIPIGGTNTTSIPLGLEVGQYYLIQFDLSIIGDTSVGVDFIMNGETFTIPAGAIDSRNKFTFYYKPTTITTDYIELQGIDNDVTVKFYSIYIYKFSSVGIAVKNNSGSITYNVHSMAGLGYVTYYVPANSYRLYSLDYPAASILWQATFDFSSWEGVEIGCSTISINDSSLHNTELMMQGAFNYSYFWTFGNYWAFTGTAAYYNPPGVIANTELTQDIIVKGGMSYTLEFDTALLGFNSLLVGYYYNGALTNVLNTSGDTTQSVTIDLSTKPDAYFTITLAFKMQTQDAEVEIDNVTLHANNVPDVYSYSECINTQTDADCTILFTATNSDNAFDFDYSHGLTHSLRLVAKKDILNFPEEKEAYLFSDNSRRLLMGRSETEYDLQIMDAPDYIHSCLRMLRLNDTFNIDGAQYIAESAYELKRRKTSKLKQAAFSVKDIDGIATNYSCS